MLSRKLSTDANPTFFEWDGMDMVREIPPTGPGTRYYVVNSVLMSFERGGVTHQLHADAMGHVRLITDGTGAVAYSASYDAWGNLLAESGTLAGSWFYGYMGAAGCRRDADTGLVYCRLRWLDTTIQRFTSRDSIAGPNRYAYAANNPTTLIDSNGLQPREWVSYSTGGAYWWYGNEDVSSDVVVLSPVGRGGQYYDPGTRSWRPLYQDGAVDMGNEARAFIFLGAAGKVVVPGAISGLSGAATRAAENGSSVGRVLSTNIGRSAGNCEGSTVGAAWSRGFGSSEGSAYRIAIQRLRPIHSRETIGSSPIQKLTDQELMQAFTRPTKGDFIRVDPYTGRVFDGNTRAVEAIDRAASGKSLFKPTTEVPFEPYIPERFDDY